MGQEGDNLYFSDRGERLQIQITDRETVRSCFLEDYGWEFIVESL